MASRIGAGMIGAGNIARQHFAGYAANSDKAQVVCVADPVETAARDKADEYGVPDVYTDYQ